MEDEKHWLMEDEKHWRQSLNTRTIYWKKSTYTFSNMMISCRLYQRYCYQMSCGKGPLLNIYSVELSTIQPHDTTGNNSSETRD